MPDWSKQDMEGVKMRAKSLIAAFVALLLSPRGIASAADVVLLAPGALESSLHDLLPDFEKSSGHRARMDFGPAGAIADRIQKGEAADVGIATAGQIDALLAQGKILPGSRANLAKVGMGVGSRKGAAKPDIGSVEALKRALLAAKSIGFPDPAGGSSSGAHAAKWIGSLDIAPQIQPKIKLFPTGAPLFEAVARGDVELAFGQLSELLAAPGVEIAGPLPAEAQNYTRFSIGVVASGKEAEAGKALVEFLTSPAALSHMRTKGFEPG